MIARAVRVTRRAATAAQRAWLRFKIDETEAYLQACARDGLTDSLSLRHFRNDIASMRVELAMLEEAPEPAHAASEINDDDGGLGDGLLRPGNGALIAAGVVLLLAVAGAAVLVASFNL